MDNRIICIGNRFIAEDGAGPAVFDILQDSVLPVGVEIIEGGLAGLNLLPHLEQGGRVIFVDAVSGFAPEGGVVVVDHETLLAKAEVEGYGHEAGLPYLLHVLPQVCEGELPKEIVLVGVEGICSKETIAQAAKMCVDIAKEKVQVRDAG